MLPNLKSDIPGPRSRALARRLRRVESHNVTYVDDEWPIFWERAKGVNIWDVDGNRFLDLTSAFGVAGLGHGPAQVLEAMCKQANELLHAMGDVHPTELKVRLCEKLVAMSFERWGEGHGKVILANSGFESIETALKTALMATGKSGVVSFEGGYHGLGYGALMAGSFERFRTPFKSQLAEVQHVLPFPRSEAEMVFFRDKLQALNGSEIGAMVVEPILGRGGKVVPPDEFHGLLREWCTENQVVLIHDEIYSGFQRTGRLFASDHWDVRPDLLCVGKAMSSGFPISACVGRADIMDAWPESSGEAIHTSTFLGHPVGCAMSLASLQELDHCMVGERVTEQGYLWQEALAGLDCPIIHEIRGKGLMLGVDMRRTDGEPAGKLVGWLLGCLLRDGVVALGDGEAGNVFSITPPFDYSEQEIEFVVSRLAHHLEVGMRKF